MGEPERDASFTAAVDPRLSGVISALDRLLAIGSLYPPGHVRCREVAEEFIRAWRAMEPRDRALRLGVTGDGLVVQSTEIGLEEPAAKRVHDILSSVAVDWLSIESGASPVTFEEIYGLFMESAAVGDRAAVSRCRAFLKEVLNSQDYEYMVWQEWKEGFARYIENRINDRLGLPENHSGKEPPFSRVTFYEGGAHFIEILEQHSPDLLIDIERLFRRMFH